MRQILVHIGTHKTGTSSIQHFLRVEAERLARAGLVVPVTGTLNPTSGHHNIAWELYRDERFDPTRGTLDRLLAELDRSGAERAVISAEDLEFLGVYPEALAGFDQKLRLAGWKPTYLVYFRKAESYVVSLYGTLRARRKIRANFVAFLFSFLRHGWFSVGPEFYELSRRRFCERWRAVTGKDALVTVDFDESTGEGGPVVRFLQIAGIDDPALLAAARDTPTVNRGKRRRRLPKLIMRAPPVRAALASVSG